MIERKRGPARFCNVLLDTFGFLLIGQNYIRLHIQCMIHMNGIYGFLHFWNISSRAFLVKKLLRYDIFSTAE